MNTVSYSASDVEWVRNLVGMLNNGGTWVCPCSASVFTFNTVDKSYSITSEGTGTHDTNPITQAILEQEMGYTEEDTE